MRLKLAHISRESGTGGLLRNPIHVTPSTSSGQALNEVKGLLTLVESSSRRFFAEFTLERPKILR